jgi:peptide/nickel transport system substrate-binding protein
LVFLVGCGQQSTTSETALPREETLYLSGQQWGTPSTFNPLAESWMAAWPVGGRFNLMYEPLITYNTLNGAFEPLLGSLIDSLSNNDSIVVDLNPKAKWSDGKPVTSVDVKFIFELGENYQGAVTSYALEQISAIHVDTLDINGVPTERLSFMVAKQKRNNPLSVCAMFFRLSALFLRMFSSSFWLKMETPLDEVKKLMMDKAAVVSGPYNLQSYSASKIILIRRDDYWGNEALHGENCLHQNILCTPFTRVTIIA